ncbi:MAG: glutamyl-tRNA reductase, partial [Phycisphaeraceae bacterium]
SVMHLVCVGISHHTAPVELREKLAMDRAQVEAALGRLRGQHPQAELAILSTCNRTEVYVARPLHGRPRPEDVLAYLCEQHHIAPEQLADAVYHYDNERAIRHLFRVTSGLDSMVIGEYQIVSQVKAAYDAAQQAQTAGKAIHRMFQLALATGKRVRSETALGEGRWSVAGIAAQFVQRLFDSLADKTVLAIGAGKMIELTLKHFNELRRGQFIAPAPGSNVPAPGSNVPAPGSNVPGSTGGRVLVCNRSNERAEQLAAKVGGRVVPFDALDEHLVQADVVVSCTAAREHIVTAARFKPLVKKRRFRPLFMLDLAVPRDIEPAVADFANVYLYDLDDLREAVAATMAERRGELEQCEQMIERAVGECYSLVQSGDVNELIRRLREQLHEIGSQESLRTLGRLTSAPA